MATSYTSLLGLALPVTGELSGTWGDTVNNSITALLDSAVAGTTTLSADADVTLTTTTGAANQARSAIILWTASNGATTRNITAPAQSKAYLVINAGTGSIVIRGVGPTTGVTIPSSARALVAWNGSDFVKIASNPVVLTTDVSGTLPVANGGTGITSFGAGVATFLGTPSSANLAAAVTDETGTGALVFATSPTLGELVTVTGTAATAGGIALGEDSDNGVNTVTVKAPAAITSNYTMTLPQTDGVTLGYLNIPQSGSAKTTSYALVTTDIGKVIEVGTGGSITVPDATFAAGDAVIIFNNTSGSITMTMTITNAYIAGTDTDKATISVATRGVANILFVTGTTCVVTGNVS
jgi:hypothetical protein